MKKVELKHTKTGIPVFHFSPSVAADFDVVDFMRKSREERDMKMRGK